MVKKKSKILVTILIISMLFTGIMYLLSRNNTAVAAYYEGQITPFNNLLSNTKLYCINHGLTFALGSYHYCYEVGEADPKMAYLVSQQTNIPRLENHDPIANAIWKLVGSSTQTGVDYQTILNEANVAATIKQGAELISIADVDTIVMENAEGKYGPFKVTYPYCNNKLIGDSVTILVNDTYLTTIPASGEEFYLTEAQGINPGEQNKIQVVYQGKSYSGTYAKFTPQRTIIKYEVCDYCGARFTSTTLGYVANGYPYNLGSWTPDSSNTHNIAYCPGTLVDESSTVYYYDTLQDLIYIEPTTSPVSDSDEIIFWAGKPNIEINIDKIDTANRAVSGVKFSVTAQNGQILNSASSVTTGSDGTASITIRPNSGATQVVVTLTETYAPANYIKYGSAITLTYTWNSTSKQWNLTTIQKPTNETVEGALESRTRVTSNCTDKFTITAVNRPIIRVYLDKTDVNLNNVSATGNPLANIEFALNITGGTINSTHEESKGVSGSTLTTDSLGEGVIIIEPNPNSTRVILTITEEESAHYIKNNPIAIIFEYDDREGQWSTTNVVMNASNLYSVKMGQESKCDLTIKNKAKIEDVTLTKINSSVLGGEVIPGVTFRITLDNAQTLAGGQLLTGTTNSNGEIELGTLQVIDPSKPISITLQEISVPNDGLNYKGLYPYGSATIKLTHRQTGCTVNNSLVTATYDITKNIVIAEIGNIVTMDISGKVWLDGQTGLKPVSSPNGTKDSSENGISGVTVNLIRNDGIIIKTIVTDNSGNYTFTDIPASMTGSIQYRVEFAYDGINYTATATGGDSKGTEIGRIAFNNKFQTIIKDMAVGANGTATSLEYSYGDKTATLQTTNGNTVKSDFAMRAQTNYYNKNTTNVDMGLVKKGVNLSATTDIYSAKVIINGKETIYDYNTILSLNDNITITDAKPSYNLYLYNSDYNYRIEDYSELPVLTSATNQTLGTSQYGTVLDKKKADGELEVELTYQILLNNQSATDATINSICYYYDTAYELVGAEPEGQVTIDGITYNKITIPVGRTFTDSDNQERYNITFTVKKNELGAIMTGEKKTWVEIESYSTNDGCVDMNSAPGNILEHKTEDDSDDARGLNIQVNIVDRTISGYVFEDTKTSNPGAYNTGDGKWQSTETKVSDVIVQLIEIKEVTVGSTTLRLEYIWQETVSGSSTVKYITTDGKNIATYQVSNAQGEYTFKDFIPGKYIVRFIYGDGTYYDTSIDGTPTSSTSKQNITTYNGQDYKSTIDTYYDKSEYNISPYEANASMARDNEARRIEEMAYATTTDANGLVIDSKAELEKTWMCAETSLIDIPIYDGQGQATPVEEQINFGLVKRPQAELSLEKHVTALKIGSVANATADIKDYYKDGGLEVNLISNSGTESVYATATRKNPENRGEWSVQTTLDTLSREEISITYSYIIKNIGDKDYIGQALSGKDYATIASTVKTEASAPGYIPGKYLGTAYYNGNTSGDVEVGISVKVEDYLGVNSSNYLQLRTGGAFTKQGSTTENVWVSSGVPGTESVNVIQSNTIPVASGSEYIISAEVYNSNLDTTTAKDFTFRSYAAQLVSADGKAITKTGMTIKGASLGNLNYVQGYTRDVLLADIVPENDESIAETVTITIDTGEDKETPVMIITAITGGLAIVAVGIVLIKKFIVK